MCIILRHSHWPVFSIQLGAEENFVLKKTVASWGVILCTSHMQCSEGWSVDTSYEVSDG